MSAELQTHHHNIQSIHNTGKGHHLSHLASDFRNALDDYVKYEKGIHLLNNLYSFQENLQTGSFGKVTSAINIQTNKLVAVKALKKSVNGVRSMANHEVAIMKHLGYHQNICQLLDQFETKKFIILVLEYAPCGDLYDAIHNKTNMGLAFQNDAKMFASLCQQIHNVVSYTHSKGVFHRDIKPENILLMRDGTIKLCDWGLATKSVKCNDFNVGTEKYMAPEALNESNDVEYYDATTVDTWSIGITLLYTLFNKCPFRKALPSDANYSSFLDDKNRLFDFYQNISTSSFSGIVDMLLIDRDLHGGLDFLVNSGVKNGFNIDQEYMVTFTEQESRYINYINNNNATGLTNNDELFMFDDEDLQEFKTDTQHPVHHQQQQSKHFPSIGQPLSSFEPSTIYNGGNCNVNPISIPLNHNNSSSNLDIDYSVSSFKNTNSLFDANTFNSINTNTPAFSHGEPNFNLQKDNRFPF